MAIRFHCKRCRQWLSIASRKTGTEIECPRCGVLQIVPSEEAAAAARAMEDALAEEEGEAIEIVTHAAVFGAPRPPQEADPRETTTEKSQSNDWIAGEVVEGIDRPVPSGMILFPRRAIYLQGVLLVVLFLAGLGSGYLIGRGVTYVAGDSAPKSGRLLVHGTLVHAPDADRLAADTEAIVIILPQDARVSNKISPIGLHPKAARDDSQESVRTIRRLGGEYARADSSGAVSLVVPNRGSYYLLIVSNHARRPEGVDVDEADLIEIQRYFDVSDLLLREYKYRWLTREIDQDLSIDWNFGRDGQGDAHQ